MMKRRNFFLALFSAAPVAAQQLPPAVTQYQSITDRNIKCPLCHTISDIAPVTLLVVGDNDTNDNSTLSDPTFICQDCGIHFCVDKGR